MALEDRLRELTRWSTVSEIPSFPVARFQDLQEAVSQGHYLLGVDPPFANQLGEVLSNMKQSKPRGGVLIGFMLLNLVCSSYLAFQFKTWLPLLAIPISVLAPFTPIGLLVLVSLLDIGALAATIQAGHHMTATLLAYLWAAYAVPLVAFKTMYQSRINDVRNAILESETLFLYAFERHGCMLKDSQSGEVISFYDPAMFRQSEKE